MRGFVRSARENLYPMVKTCCLLSPHRHEEIAFVQIQHGNSTGERLDILKHFSVSCGCQRSGEWIRHQLVAGCSYNTPAAGLFCSVSLLSQPDTCLQVPLIKEMSDFACSIDQNKLPAANLWTSQKCLWHGELCSVVQVIGLSGNVTGCYTVISHRILACFMEMDKIF